MAQLPSPFSSDPKTFAAVVAIAAKLLEDGKILLKVSPGGNISYNVPSIDLRPAAERLGIRSPVVRNN